MIIYNKSGEKIWENKNIDTLSGANLSEFNLREANLYVADLSGANLRGADLREANLCGANLRGANLSGADLCGANLSESNLCGANLYGADLYGANLRGANLRGADLRGAELASAKFYGKGGQIKLTQTQLPNFLGALGFELEEAPSQSTSKEVDFSNQFSADNVINVIDAAEYLKSNNNLTNITDNKFMRKLSELSQKIRRAFSPEQKSLWRANYIDECGKWTDKANQAVIDMACDEKKKELVDLANEEISLYKEEKKEEE